MTHGLFYQHCRTLGLETVTDEAALKTAYRREINRWHPDRHHQDPASHAQAQQRAKEINSAYEYLSELLEEGRTPPPQAASEDIRTTWRSYADSYRTRHTYQRKSYATGFPDALVVEIFVKSSNIVSVGFDSSRSILYVKFGGSGVYRYFDVPASVFEALLAAASHGKYLNAAVIGRFRYERC